MASLAAARRFAVTSLRAGPIAAMPVRLARPMSTVPKVLRRELKHDLDSGSAEMPGDLVDLFAIVKEKFTIKVSTFFWALKRTSS